MKSAVWAKYQASGNYKHLTHEQRTALARAEINMTMFGYVGLSDAKTVAEIKGEVTKNKSSKTDAEDREFNRYTLSKQIANVFKNNGMQFFRMLLRNWKVLMLWLDKMVRLREQAEWK